MKITFAPRDIIQIDDAKIVYRNFSGVGGRFNREGDRNFAVVIEDEEYANALSDAGWKLKIRDSINDRPPFIYLPVKIKFNDRGPNVYLETNGSLTKLHENTIDILDNVEILKVDLDIRPYDWEVNGKTGRSAYLQSIKVTQQVDRFANTGGICPELLNLEN